MSKRTEAIRHVVIGGAKVMFDPRSTAKADEQRSTTNGKPYRTREEKQEAQQLAKKVDGRWVSSAPCHFPSV